MAVVVAHPEGEPDLEEVVGKHRQDGVAPLDEHDATLVEHLREPQVEGLAHLLEAVHVEVVHGQAALVDVDEREGGARDAIGDTQPAAESLDERRLAGTEVAGQHDDVARPGQRRDGAGQVAGRVDGGGGGDHGHVGAAYERPYRRSTLPPSAHTTS